MDNSELKGLDARVKQMAQEWGLPEYSTFEDQMRFSDEEVREVMMELGDVMVTAKNAENLARTTEQVESASRRYYQAMWAAVGLGVSHVECYRMAIEKNAKRVGTMLDGKWTKWQNLPHSHRLIVAKSGQLSRPHVDVSDLLMMCSPDERVEILDVIAP